MSERAKILDSDIVFDPTNYPVYKRALNGALKSFNNLDRLLNGIEKRPVLGILETAGNLQKRDTCYLQRVRLAVDFIQSTVSKHMTKTNDESYYQAIELLDHPYLIQQKMDEILLPKGCVETATSVIAWVSSDNRSKQLSYDKHYVEHNARFKKNESVTMSALNGIIYLNSLSPDYGTIIQEFLSKPNFTAEEVYKKIQAHELISNKAKTSSNFSSAFIAAETDGSALYSSGSSTGSLTKKKAANKKDNNKSLSSYRPQPQPKSHQGQGGGRQANTRGSKSSGRGSGDRYMDGDYKITRDGTRIKHDYWNHPNNPTDFERSKTCNNCLKDGHCIRTCTVRPLKQTKSHYKERSFLCADFDFSDEPEQPSAEWYAARDSRDSRVTPVITVTPKFSGFLYLSQQHLSALLFFTLLVAVAIRMFPPISIKEYAYMMQEDEDYSSSSSSSSKRHKSKGLFDFLRFFVDSGASQHMTKVDESYFSTFTKHFRTSNQPDSSIAIGTASGTPLFSSGQGAIGNVARVLQVPGLTENLFSVKEACRNGYKVLFHDNRCDIFEPDDIQTLSLPVLSAFLKAPSFTLYELRIYASPEEEEFSIGSDESPDSHWDTAHLAGPSPQAGSAHLANTKPINTYQRFHHRLPHPSHRTMQHLQKHSNWINVPAWNKKEATESQQHHCKGCALGKMTMSHFERANYHEKQATAPGELIFMDTWFSNVASITGRKCALIFVDAFSRKLWLKYMDKKEQAFDKIQEWVAEVKLEGINLTNGSAVPRATALKSDNGG